MPLPASVLGAEAPVLLLRGALFFFFFVFLFFPLLSFPRLSKRKRREAKGKASSFGSSLPCLLDLVRPSRSSERHPFLRRGNS
ncbi:unnamed protein product [Victoria cruziana]